MHEDSGSVWCADWILWSPPQDLQVVHSILLPHYGHCCCECKTKGKAPVHLKAFGEIEQLMQVGSQRSTPGPSQLPSGLSDAHRLLVFISGERISGWLKCHKYHVKTAACSTLISPCALCQVETVIMNGALKLCLSTEIEKCVNSMLCCSVLNFLYFILNYMNFF